MGEGLNTASPPPGRLRSGHVTLLQLVGQCFSVGPLIDVALFLGIVASMAGAVGPLAVALAALGMLAFSLVVAFYASETGGAGAMGDYAGRAWGKTAGVAVLGIYVVSLIFSGAAGFSIAVGELAAQFAARYAGMDLPWWAGALAAAAAAWWLNVRGAGAATRAQLVIVGASVIPFVLTAFAAIAQAGAANTWAVFSWGNPHAGDLFGALLFCILLFGGFETAGALAEETDNPRRSIPLALVGTVGAVAVLLVLCSYAGTVYYGPANAAKDWGGVLDGYARMADDLLGSWAGWWIRFAVLVDFTATCIGFTVAASRGIFALARSGLLPARLAATNSLGAPQTAATLVLALALLAIAAGSLVPSGQRYDTLFVAATSQAVLLVIVYSALALGALRLMLRQPGGQPRWRWIVFPLAAVVPGLALYGTFVPFPDYPERLGLYAGLAALAATIAWVGWLRARGRI
ncbi:MAG: APC family permease [Chthoniobacterales bacterium]|nr:APC family permease [Chthoniobacterales bacterium]